MLLSNMITKRNADFPGSPVVKISPSNARGVALIPGLGAKILYASWPKVPNIKQIQQICTKFNKDVKNICIQKKIFKKLTKRDELVRWIIGKPDKSMDQVVPLLGGEKEHGRF